MAKVSTKYALNPRLILVIFGGYHNVFFILKSTCY